MAAPTSAAPVKPSTEVQCSTCGASVAFEAGQMSAACPYCASPTVAGATGSLAGMPAPEYVLGFSLGLPAARARAVDWLRHRSIFTEPSVRMAPAGKLRGVYVPVYLYSAISDSAYTASIGEYYWETETYTTTDSKGRTVVRTRRVRRTEWRSLSGVRSEYVTDVIVSASRGLPNAELEMIEPFDLRALRRWTPAMISGWAAEQCSLSPAESAGTARREAWVLAGRRLDSFMPGDTHSDLKHETTFRNESLALVLAPIWVLSVAYDPKKPPFRLLVNGQTGKLYGKPPKSRTRVGIAIGCGVALVLGAALAVLGGLVLMNL